MAGVKLYPGRMMTKTAMMTRDLAGLRPYVEEAKKVLNEPEDNIALLKGNGWDSVRKYIETVQRPLLSSYSLWLEAQLAATERYRCAASALPGVQCLDQDKLRSELANYRRRLAREQSKEHPSRSAIRHYRSMIREIESKLQDIEKFLQRTAGIYDEVQQAQSKLKHANTTLPKVGYTLLMKGLRYTEAGESWLPILMAFLDARIEAVKEAEFTECLELLLGEKGSMYLSQILSKGEISDIEAQAIAYALIVKGDDQLLETFLQGSYRFVEVKTTPGQIVTTNVIFERTENFDKVYQNMKVLNQLLFTEAAMAEPEQVKQLLPKLLTSMQYTEVLKQVNEADYRLVVCSYTNIYDPLKTVFIKGGNNAINFERDEQNALVVKWVKYAEAGNNTLDYTAQNLVSVTVSMPTQGSGAQDQTVNDSLKYIRSGFGIGDYGAVTQAVGKEIRGLFTDMIPGESVFSALQSIVSTAAEVHTQERVFKNAETIASFGVTLNLFNLFYVSSITELEGKIKPEYDFIIYPSFRSDQKVRAQLSTQECIDIFNVNFGDNGVFNDAFKDIALDEPLTMKDFQENIDEIVNMVEKWGSYSRVNGISLDEATEQQSTLGN